MLSYLFLSTFLFLLVKFKFVRLLGLVYHRNLLHTRVHLAKYMLYVSCRRLERQFCARLCFLHALAFYCCARAVRRPPLLPALRAAGCSPSQVHAVLGLDRPGDVGRRMEKRKTPSICWVLICNKRSRAVHPWLHCVHRTPPWVNLAKYNVAH